MKMKEKTKPDENRKYKPNCDHSYFFLKETNKPHLIIRKN